jgi:hypothetical protein
MGSRIPAIRIKSRFCRYVVGGATFFFYDQLLILEPIFHPYFSLQVTEQQLHQPAVKKELNR